LSVFGDLYRTLDDETADALTAAIATHRKRRRGRLSEVRDPWAGWSTPACGRGFRLLTSNAKDFADIPGWQLVVLKLP